MGRGDGGVVGVLAGGEDEAVLKNHRAGTPNRTISDIYREHTRIHLTHSSLPLGSINLSTIALSFPLLWVGF